MQETHGCPPYFTREMPEKERGRLQQDPREKCGELKRRQKKVGRDWGEREDIFTDTQTDGEKSRDTKRQTHADGERGGGRKRQKEMETDGQRDTRTGKCREKVFKNKLRKYFSSVSAAFILNFSQRIQMPSLAPSRASRKQGARVLSLKSRNGCGKGGSRSWDKKRPHMAMGD